MIHVDEATCHNLSTFKGARRSHGRSRVHISTLTSLHAMFIASELMKEYRKLDDTVTMRMNRTLAQFRDRDRHGWSASSPQEESCAYFWAELVANWRKRAEIIQYCVNAVDQSIGQKEQMIETQDLDATAQRSLKSASYAERVKRNQIHNELTVEAIVRQRSLEAFKNRCRYFVPPLTDAEARKWWEAGKPNDKG